MIIDWNKVEEQLHLLVAAEVPRIAKKYKDECFYGFALDCNTDYGDVLISLNTPAGLKESVLGAMDPADPQKKVWAEISANLDRKMREFAVANGKVFSARSKPAPKTEADYERDYRWELGDWKFMDVQSREFDSAWKPFREAIASAAAEDSIAIGEEFMELACRVMARLETGGQLACLPRTVDFKTFVCNHDESMERAESRLNRIRGALSAN